MRMADELPHSPRDAPSRQGQQQQPQRGGQPPQQQPGWRITPAPDGRGGNPPNPKSGRNQRIILIAVVLGLLLLNYWVSSQALSSNPRVQIPYSPTFLTSVQNGNVVSISSTGDTIE